MKTSNVISDTIETFSQGFISPDKLKLTHMQENLSIASKNNELL